jgi:hypothetical protein
VQFVSVPDAGVPNTGATKAVPEGRVTVPVKVGLAFGASNASAASALVVSVEAALQEAKDALPFASMVLTGTQTAPPEVAL